MGGDGGIGRAVAIAFAKEGADIAIIYLNEHREAENTRQAILQANVRCILVAGDVTREASCRSAVKRVIAAFGRLDILVNNAAEQQPQVDHREVAHVQRVPHRTDESARHVPADEGGTAAFARRRCHHQHDRGDGLA